MTGPSRHLPSSLWVLAWFAPACGDDAETSKPPEEIALLALCGRVAGAECDRLRECSILFPPLDFAACKVRVEQVICNPIAETYSASVNSGAVTYDPVQAGHCAGEIGARTCSVGLDAPLFESEECRRVLSGQRAEGQNCFIQADCADGLECSLSAQTCPGTCRLARAANETCSATERCQNELFCALPAMRCQPRVPRDQPCELAAGGENTCQDGNFCDRSQPGNPRCAAGRGRNTGCVSAYECAAELRCIDRLCSGGQANDTCLRDADCQSSLACFMGRCRPWIEPAAPCVLDGVRCKEGHTCTSSASGTFCLEQGQITEPCELSVGCYLGQCLDSSCAAAVGDRQPCNNPNECLPGRSCDSGRCSLVLACKI